MQRVGELEAVADVKGERMGACVKRLAVEMKRNREI